MWVTFKHCDLFVTCWKSNVLFSTKNHHVKTIQKEETMVIVASERTKNALVSKE